ARADVEPGLSPVGDPQKLQLQKKSEELRSKIAITKAEDASALRNQLSAVEGRLQKLETDGKFAEAIIQSYKPSICLIHVVLALRDHTTGQRLHYAGVTSSGEPTVDEHKNPLLSLTGNGPEVRLDIFGTGFLASSHGQILTNHHVAEPWWQNDELKEMLDQGLEPEIAEMTAYFPGVTHGIPITTKKTSSDADVAVVKGSVSGLGIRHIALADDRHSAIGGSPFVLLGFPTGVDAIRARTGDVLLHVIPASPKSDQKQ